MSPGGPFARSGPRWFTIPAHRPFTLDLARGLAEALAPRERSTGFERPEGFLRSPEGRLTHSNSPNPPPPFNNIGFQILDPKVLQGHGPGGFSIVPIWKQLSAEGRLYGSVIDGFDMHISDPPAIGAAEARLKAPA